MDLTHDDVLNILRLIDQSSYEEIHLEAGGFKLVVKKKSPTLHNPQAILRDVPERVGTGRAGGGPEVRGNVHVLAAPMVGVFYRSPAPGEPPFVDVGSLVTEDETVCIIEVMKLMHAVKAGFRGRVAEILAEDARPVEYGQPLLAIEPLS